jgi:hypothetical protein
MPITPLTEPGEEIGDDDKTDEKKLIAHGNGLRHSLHIICAFIPVMLPC